MKRILSIIISIIILSSITVFEANAVKSTAIPSGIDDSSDYLLKVPDEGNNISYTGWKTHGLAWTSFDAFCKTKYDPDKFLYSTNTGYIHTKKLNGENFYEAEFNMDINVYNTLKQCYLIALQPVQIQFDNEALTNGVSVPLGDYIDTTPYKYVATRIKIEGGREYQKKILSIMLRAKGRDQYIDNMVGTYLINNKTRKVTGPTANMKYIEVENGFDGWIVMPVEDMAEGKPLSELITVTFYCHSTGMDKTKCDHGAPDTAWDYSTLYIGDMMLVRDIEKFNSARTDCNVMGHIFGSPVIKEPTTTKEGSSTVTCNVCKTSQITSIPKLANSIKGNKVEGLSATLEVIGDSNITSDVYLNAQNVTSTIKAKEKNSVIRAVNSLSDKIKSRKLASILDLKLVTKSKDENGNIVNTDFSLSGNVKITVPVDSKVLNKYKDLSLVHVKADGTATLLEYTIKDGKAIFETEGFGYFAFVGREKTASDVSEIEEEVTENESEISSSTESKTESSEVITDNGTKENKTENNFTLTVIIIAFASVIALGLIIFAVILFIKK